jgi:DNA-binding response OmpR family regulator
MLLNGVEITGIGRKEERILEYLALRHGKWVSRNELMDLLYADNDNAPYDNIISAYVSKIRRQFKGVLDIQGAYNFGYRLKDCVVYLRIRSIIVFSVIAAGSMVM